MKVAPELEAAIRLQDTRLGKPQTEYRFHPERRWRFDFCYPEVRLAIEIEGGTWNRGRHVRAQGYANDCAKYNAAACLGWSVLRFTSEMVRRGCIEEAVREWLRVRERGVTGAVINTDW